MTSAACGALPADDRARIVVADDAESNRYVIATWLRRAGYDVKEASTAKDVLAIAATEAIDMYVLDVNLPDMSGYDVCEHLKGQERTAAVPVLHVSATAIAPSDRSEGLRRGADGYLVEPVEREELLASVEALLRGAAAQRTAVRLATLLRRLNDATLAVNEVETIEGLVRTIAEEACKLFEGAAIAAVLLEERSSIAVGFPRGIAEVQPAPPHLTVELCRIAETRSPVGADALAGLVPALPASAVFLAHDLSDPAGHTGALFVQTATGWDAAAGDETAIVLTQFARAANTALTKMRTYDIERHIALTLQRSLLPDVSPSIAGLDVALRYEASAAHAQVGGDFYELFTIGDQVGFAIGDVVGHSLEAATVMAELRTGIRAYMLEKHGPSATLELLNRLLLHFHPDQTATICCAIYDRRSGRCRIANAGHPPALLITSGRTTFLPLGGPLLGVAATMEEPHEFTLATGDVLLLYTDGLIERRAETIDQGLERLAAVGSGPVSDLDAFCDRVLHGVGPRSRTDDIALVAIRPNGRY